MTTNVYDSDSDVAHESGDAEYAYPFTTAREGLLQKDSEDEIHGDSAAAALSVCLQQLTELHLVDCNLSDIGLLELVPAIVDQKIVVS